MLKGGSKSCLRKGENFDELFLKVKLSVLFIFCAVFIKKNVITTKTANTFTH